MTYPYQLPPLPYSYANFETEIDSETMYYHHDKHFATYVNNLNDLLNDNANLQKMPLDQLLQQDNLSQKILNNAGGVYNHNLFFNEMAVPYDFSEIISVWGSIAEFKVAFKEAALSVFGSGYAWVVRNKDGHIDIITTKNQDTPLAQNLIPLLTLDVWEHAYYLNYKNNRSGYIDGWFKAMGI